VHRQSRLPGEVGLRLICMYESLRVRSYPIVDPRVSKRHFRIYSVIYEKAKHDEFPPLVYCEDLESTNGTYVNDSCIGMLGIERVGHLLNDGDVVEIKPSWRFKFHQPQYTFNPRSLIVNRDLNHFDDRYTVSNRVLGKGQYGAVYLAQEILPTTTKQLACKIVNIREAVYSLQEDSNPDASNMGQKRAARSKPDVDNVMREIRILSKLSHVSWKLFCTHPN
jgi:hypothetical protein